MRAPFIGSALALVLASACSPSAACIVGSTQACLCVGGGTGVQSCVAGGTYSACVCGDVDGGMPDASTPEDGGPILDDAGVPTDAPMTGTCPSPLTMCGDACVDTRTDEMHCGGCADATHTCAEGFFCVMGECTDVSSCPAPFVTCDGECIDPRTDPAHCGASGACTGDEAGATCGGVCSDGECVFESCSDVLASGASVGDGLYLVDVDGTGARAPQRVYCDMTTDGGGWTLVYKIRNDVPDIADPWWGMVALGSGDAFPSAPTPVPSGMHFEGPTREARDVYCARAGSGPMNCAARFTLIRSTGETVIDARGYSIGPLGRIVSGAPGTPPAECSGSYDSPGMYVISAVPGLALATGDRYGDCYQIIAGHDVVNIRRTAGSEAVPMTGDGAISMYGAMFANSTTLFWVRGAP